MLEPFDEPIYVTRPFLPPLASVIEQLADIWDSQCLTNGGKKHQQLEGVLKNLLRVKNISLFNNGTTALSIACSAAGLTGEVITTPFTFPATPHVLSWAGMRPVFCDIDEGSLTLNANLIEDLITPRTTAILGVHVYGIPCDVEKIQQIATRHNLKVLYDGAHAFGTQIGENGIGTYGDICMFSFHATKLFHTLEGGALTYNDDTLRQPIELQKNFGIKNEEEVVLPGINGKMNELQAAIGLLVARDLESERLRRKRIVDTYKNMLSGVDGLTILEPPANVRPSYQYLVVRINKERFGTSRDEVYRYLREYNVHSRKYFYPLCSDFGCYRELPSANPRMLPVSQQVVQEVLCLPLYGSLPLESVERISELILLASKKPALIGPPEALKS